MFIFQRNSVLRYTSEHVLFERIERKTRNGNITVSKISLAVIPTGLIPKIYSNFKYFMCNSRILYG